MIETNRLRCEPLRSEHAETMFSVLSDPRIYTYLPDRAPESLEALRKRYHFQSQGRSPDGTEHWLNWILFLKCSGEAIGFWQATVRPGSCSVAWVLGPTHWGKGLAREASAALITHLFERFDLPSIQAEIHFENQPSHALVQRLGFQLVRKDFSESDDIYEMTRNTWTRR